VLCPVQHFMCEFMDSSRHFSPKRNASALLIDPTLNPVCRRKSIEEHFPQNRRTGSRTKKRTRTSAKTGQHLSMEKPRQSLDLRRELVIATCSKCGGKKFVTCPVCKGKGQVSASAWTNATKQCDNCSGSGSVKCGVCSGRGSI
jgi:DnaJ-class molecular chaperone